MLDKLFRRFIANRRGNVATIFAIAIVPLLFVTGMGVDYTAAADREVELNAAADAAALAAVTPTMMAQSVSAATTVAKNTFNAQSTNVPNVTYSANNVTVTINSSGAKRTVTVAYSAQSANFFPSVLGMSAITISGSAQATAGLAPNIDFYLVLDDSPSMAIAATQSGINTMVSNTSSQGGCAFGCHEAHPSQDNLGNPGGEDNYTLARNLGVTLRIDLVNQAAQNLMSSAQSTETSNNASYRMAIYTFDTAFNTLGTLTSNLTTAKTEASNIASLEVYANNWLTSTNANSDTDTNYDNAMTRINSIIPNPGSGTNTAGDTPQAVLFFVTDGVEDEMVGALRQQSLMDNGWCTTIKNRGIRIAVLYTTYLPLPTNGWYNTYIAGFQPNISAQMQNCASPGLFYEVQTGGDISAAMVSLFQLAVQSAYLTQ